MNLEISSPHPRSIGPIFAVRDLAPGDIAQVVDRGEANGLTFIVTSIASTDRPPIWSRTFHVLNRPDASQLNGSMRCRKLQTGETLTVTA